MWIGSVVDIQAGDGQVARGREVAGCADSELCGGVVVVVVAFVSSKLCQNSVAAHDGGGVTERLLHGALNAAVLVDGLELNGEEGEEHRFRDGDVAGEGEAFFVFSEERESISSWRAVSAMK